MWRGLLHLTWLEIKVFVREPMGLVGSVVIPVVFFVVLSRALGGRGDRPPGAMATALLGDLPILVAMLIALSAVQSLVTIIAIYREGGILKRLRATPLRPHTILGAHVLVKLTFTAMSLAGMILVGRRYYPVPPDVPLVSFGVALLFVTLCILSIGFLIASLVPTARFAQPLGALLLYPMLAVSGLFVPVAALPPVGQALARVLPLTYAVSLLRGVWRGEGWLAHVGDVGALALVFGACLVLSSRLFRWE